MNPKGDMIVTKKV